MRGTGAISWAEYAKHLCGAGRAAVPENIMQAQSRLPMSELIARWLALQNGDLACGTDWYELDAFGRIIELPRPNPGHQLLVAHITAQISAQLGELAVPAVAVGTSVGIIVPDIVWMPKVRWDNEVHDTVLFGPDVCVEVAPFGPIDISQARIRAYLDGGTKEVIVVDVQGKIRYWRQDGECANSSFGLTLSVDRWYLAER